MSASRLAAWLVAASMVTVGLAAPPPAGSQTTGAVTAAPQVARVYDAIFDARFEQIPALLTQTCGPAPREVCRLLETVATWWQIQIDPNDTSRDEAFRLQADAAIAEVEAWTRREPQRSEAWFYLGGAYGARVQWRVLRGQQLAAARDGKRIKDALERALALSPGLQDAFFGIGLYHYYADVAPAAAKVLRFLLMLPGGDKAAGLREMLRARDGGQLLRDEADYQLHVLYLWYEHEPQRAIDLLAGLRDRHPRNPHFPQLIAGVQDVYQHDLTASLRSWQALVEAARARRVELAPMAEAAGRLGTATQLDRLFETDLAIDELRAVIAARPTAPAGVLAQASLQLGLALDRLGRRSDAVAAYNAAIAAAGREDTLRVAERARAALRTTPRGDITEAYRLSIDGLRALERGALADAERALARSLVLRPDDPVTRYRQARLLVAQRRDAAALTTLDGLARTRGTTPPTIYASACLDAAVLHERIGTRARAIELYTLARGVFGADQRTKDSAQRALARLAAPAPR